MTEQEREREREAESVVYVLAVNEREDIKISPQLESYSLHYVGNKCIALWSYSNGINSESIQYNYSLKRIQ